jgi:proteasome lid subunit RPN8/RPN11
MDEESAVLVGYRRGNLWYGRLRRRQVGTPSSIEFDWDWVLGREEHHGDVAGFFHTHPPSHERPSARDVRTMRAWVSSFGKPLLCVIESDNVLTATVYRSDDDEGELLREVQRFPRNVIVGAEGRTEAARTETPDTAIEEV